MKKKPLLIILALLCALTCTVCLAACNEEKDTMTAEKWSASFANFESADNFTYVFYRNSVEVSRIKADGNKFYIKNENGETIVAKESESYNKYEKASDAEKWTKTAMTEQEFNTCKNNYLEIPADYALFKDDFASFTFSDGKYTSALINKEDTEGVNVQNIEISFKNDAVSYLKFDVLQGQQGVRYVFENVGSTSVTVPTVGNDDNGDEEVDGTAGLAYELNTDEQSYCVTGKGNATDTEIEIPAEYKGKPVTRIKDNAFAGDNNIEGVYFPESVTHIEAQAFMNCTGLIRLGMTGVTNIGMRAFEGCAIVNLELPQTLQVIESYAFSKCENIQSVTIPASARTMGVCVFRECTRLKTVNLEEGLTVIGDSCFAKCDDIVSIVLPKSITKVGDYALDKFTAVYYLGNEDEWYEIDQKELNSKTKLYFYSENKPTVYGNFWHFVDNAPAVWSLY